MGTIATGHPEQLVFVDDIDGDVIQIDVPATTASSMEVPRAVALPRVAAVAPLRVLSPTGLRLGNLGQAVDHHRPQAARTGPVLSLIHI